MLNDAYGSGGPAWLHSQSVAPPSCASSKMIREPIHSGGPCPTVHFTRRFGTSSSTEQRRLP